MIAAKFTNFLSRIKALQARLVLPELYDPLVGAAASFLLKEGLVQEVIFPGISEKLSSSQSAGLLRKYTAQIKTKEDLETPFRESSLDVYNLAAFILRENRADLAIAGVCCPTATVLRAGIKVLGLKPGIKLVTSSFCLLKKNESDAISNQDAYLFSDCAVVVDPSSEQLSDIAYSCAETWECLFGADTPARVGFLSFSSQGSAQGASVTKVKEAVEIFKLKHPEILCDGEMQFDTAMSPEIASKKMPESQVAGQVNCFIFPNLDAGNISYKLAQRWGGCESFGPIVQGLLKPYSDLSRGASAKDIVNSICIDILRIKI